MRRLSLPIVAFLALAIPSVAFAETTLTSWDFRNGQVPGDWNVSKTMTAEPLSDGVHLQANDDGLMSQRVSINHPADLVRFYIVSTAPVQPTLVWEAKGKPGMLIQRPFTVQGTGKPETIVLDMGTYPKWDMHPKELGLGVPAGNSVIFVGMEVEGSRGLNRLLQGWLSFWHFDTFTQYTINFLWGPRVTFTPDGRAAMFDSTPPVAVSANQYLYWVIAIAAVLLIAHWFFIGRTRGTAGHDAPLRKRSPSLWLFLCLISGLWVFYDIRMGAEILSYNKTDYDTYISKPKDERKLRGFEHFYRMVDATKDTLMREPHYVVLAPPGPFAGILRYETFPSLPVTAEDPKDAQLIFVFYRPDVRIDADRRLVVGNTYISPPGVVMADFGNNSFLFRADE